MTKVTIKDVAREAGVSISTVSNALNDVDVVNAETKGRVLDAAKRLKYIPNLNGKNHKIRKTKTIGFYTQSIEGFYYGMVADAISKACEMRGYELVIHVTVDKKRVIRSILGHNEDGVIIIYEDLDNELYDSIKEYGIPVVFLEREICSEKISSVSFDSYGAGKVAARCLIDAGRKRIGYVRGVVGSYDDDERFRGFIDEIRNSDAVYDKSADIIGWFEERKSYNVVTEYLRNTPDDKYVDAFFAANDTSAIGCINAIMDFGLNVPEDISVVGCDGIDLTKFVKPVVTTVKNPIDDQGRTAVELLIDLIDEVGLGMSVKLPVKLERGESV